MDIKIMENSNVTEYSSSDSPDVNVTRWENETLHPQVIWANYLWICFSPILIMLGTFGNIMSIVVLRRKAVWRMSSAPYLSVLGVSDIFVLYTGLLRQWLRYLIDLDIRGLSTGLCKFHTFSVSTFLDFSVWILVAVSFERFICVCFPFKAKTLCTRKRAFLAMALILICVCLLNSHFLYGYGIVQDPKQEVWVSRCTYLYDEYGRFVDEVWPWIELQVYFVVPFCFILVCNFCLILKILQTRRKNKVAHSTQGGTEQRGVKPSAMTALLVSLNTLFLVTTAPITIYLIGYTYWANGATVEEDAQLTLWWAIVNILMYLNSSVNFIFYCITSPRFCVELKTMCGRSGPGEEVITVSRSLNKTPTTRAQISNLTVNTVTPF